MLATIPFNSHSFQVLSNPETRRMYDVYGEKSEEMPGRQQQQQQQQHGFGWRHAQCNRRGCDCPSCNPPPFSFFTDMFEDEVWMSFYKHVQRGHSLLTEVQCCIFKVLWPHTTSPTEKILVCSHPSRIPFKNVHQFIPKWAKAQRMSAFAPTRISLGLGRGFKC